MPAMVLGSTVTRVRAGTGTVCTTGAASARANVNVAVVAVSPGLSSASRVSKNVDVAPSARYRVYVGFGTNVAVTVRAWSITTVHDTLPVQAPLQPENADAVDGVATRVTVEPCEKKPAQAAPQSMIPAGTVLLTVPLPVPAVATVSW